mgnify:CR=1 FL=1
MKLPLIFAAPLLVALAWPAAAAEQKADAPSPSLSDLGRSFKNALSEEETSLLIEYMRDSVLAAFNDEEVTLPPDLAFKLEVLQQRLKKESNYYLDNFLKQLEADIKRSLKEKMEVPPAKPYTPPPVPLLVPAMTAPPPASMPSAAMPPASMVPPSGYVQTPWGYVPWFYVPPPNNAAPGYTPPELPRFVAPAANNPR